MTLLKEITRLEFYCDKKRHLVCKPYSIKNLHLMAVELNISRAWFHKDHYDIPKRRIEEITAKCKLVRTRDILFIIGRRKWNLLDNKDDV